MALEHADICVRNVKCSVNLSFLLIISRVEGDNFCFSRESNHDTSFVEVIT
jgi:hypothetical protein